MVNQKTATALLILFFSLGVAFLPGDVHAFGGCCPLMDSQGSHLNQMRAPFSTGTCAVDCCSGFDKSFCNSKECRDPDPPVSMVSTPTTRRHILLNIRFSLKEDAGNDPLFVCVYQRDPFYRKAVYPPIYLSNVSLLC